MKCTAQPIFFFALFFVLPFFIISSFGQVSEVKGFRIPDYDDDGQLKSQLFGDVAKMNQDNTVDITRLRIELYKNGVIDLTVTAPQCTFDRKNGVASSPSAVRITQEQVVVTGKDFTYSTKDQRFTIRDEARVVLKNVDKQMNAGDK